MGKDTSLRYKNLVQPSKRALWPNVHLRLMCYATVERWIRIEYLVNNWKCESAHNSYYKGKDWILVLSQPDPEWPWRRAFQGSLHILKVMLSNEAITDEYLNPLYLYLGSSKKPVQFSHSIVSGSLWPISAARHASQSITNSWSLLKLMSIESVMTSNHLILCRPLLLLPSIFPSIFSKE